MPYIMQAKRGTRWEACKGENGKGIPQFETALRAYNWWRCVFCGCDPTQYRVLHKPAKTETLSTQLRSMFDAPSIMTNSDLEEECDDRGLLKECHPHTLDLLRWGIEDKDWGKVKEAYEQF